MNSYINVKTIPLSQNSYSIKSNDNIKTDYSKIDIICHKPFFTTIFVYFYISKTPREYQIYKYTYISRYVMYRLRG